MLNFFMLVILYCLVASSSHTEGNHMNLNLTLNIITASIFEYRHLDIRRAKHRSSKVETSILRKSTPRSSKVDTSISEGRHIDLRMSTHRSPKVETSIFEGKNIVLRKSKHRSSKVETSIFESRSIVSMVEVSIFEGRHIDLRRSKQRSSKVDTSIFERRNIDFRSSKVANEYCPQRRSIGKGFL